MTECVLLTDLRTTVSGVTSVISESNRMIVQFRDGKTATVARSPLSNFSDRESFDVYLPSERAGFAAQVAPSKSSAEVIEMLNQLAAKAA